MANVDQHQSILYKTKFCSFFQEGRCRRGKKCGFAHDREELGSQPDLTKTSMCKEWLSGTCNFVKCRFAHGKHELRRISSRRKEPPQHSQVGHEILPAQILLPGLVKTTPSDKISRLPAPSKSSTFPQEVCQEDCSYNMSTFLEMPPGLQQCATTGKIFHMPEFGNSTATLASHDDDEGVPAQLFSAPPGLDEIPLPVISLDNPSETTSISAASYFCVHAPSMEPMKVMTSLMSGDTEGAHEVVSFDKLGYLQPWNHWDSDTVAGETSSEEGLSRASSPAPRWAHGSILQRTSSPLPRQAQNHFACQSFFSPMKVGLVKP
jgi:hypothetical protein